MFELRLDYEWVDIDFVLNLPFKARLSPRACRDQPLDSRDTTALQQLTGHIGHRSHTGMTTIHTFVLCLHLLNY